MKIAIIGAGNVGSTLGRRWAVKHQVWFGVRNPKGEKALTLKNRIIGQVTVGSVSEAAAAADVIVLATPFSAAQEALVACGNLTNKVVVDCTNPLADNLQGLTIGHTNSAAEEVSRWAQGARVVKAFNTTGSANMADPTFGDRKAAMFLCGDDAAARKLVTGLAAELGFDPIDCGALQAARYLEPLAMLWVHLTYRQGFGPNFAFGILRRDD